MKRLALALWLALLTPSVFAASASGNDLLARCTAYEESVAGEKLTPDETLDAMWCIGYVSGLLDGFSVSNFRIGETVAVCPPQASLSRGDALAIIMDWLRKNPEELPKSGRRSAVLALSQAFPCARN